MFFCSVSQYVWLRNLIFCRKYNFLELDYVYNVEFFLFHCHPTLTIPPWDWYFTYQGFDNWNGSCSSIYDDLCYIVATFINILKVCVWFSKICHFLKFWPVCFVNIPSGFTFKIIFIFGFNYDWYMIASALVIIDTPIKVSENFR